jgi:hypothetical protein
MGDYNWLLKVVTLSLRQLPQGSIFLSRSAFPVILIKESVILNEVKNLPSINNAILIKKSVILNEVKNLVRIIYPQNSLEYSLRRLEWYLQLFD